MFDNLSLFRLADGLARHAGQRQSEIARNVANADTPGYRAGDVADFAETLDGAGELPLRTRNPRHLGGGDARGWRRIDAPDGQSPNGNTVSLEDQMLKSAQNRHSHETALGVYATTLSILRASIGGRS